MVPIKCKIIYKLTSIKQNDYKKFYEKIFLFYSINGFNVELSLISSYCNNFKILSIEISSKISYAKLIISLNFNLILSS